MKVKHCLFAVLLVLPYLIWGQGAVPSVIAKAQPSEYTARRESLRYALREKENRYLSMRKKDPTELVHTLTALGWYELLTQEPAQAERRFRTALELDSLALYAQCNLPHALFLQGKVAESQQLYREWLDQPFLPGFATLTFRMAFAADFEVFEKEHLVPDSLQAVFGQLKQLFQAQPTEPAYTYPPPSTRQLGLPLALNDSTAQALATTDTSPEAAVAYFLAARMRGDSTWTKDCQIPVDSAAKNRLGWAFWANRPVVTYAEIGSNVPGTRAIARIPVLVEITTDLGGGNKRLGTIQGFFVCQLVNGRWVLIGLPT